MPQLIKNIQGVLEPNIEGAVSHINSVYGVIQQEDYINLYGDYIAFLQDLTQTDYTKALETPLTFGLPNNNSKFNTIEIDY